MFNKHADGTRRSRGNKTRCARPRSLLMSDISRLLIEKKVGRSARNFGTAARKWSEQLDEIRSLPCNGPRPEAPRFGVFARLWAWRHSRS